MAVLVLPPMWIVCKATHVNGDVQALKALAHPAMEVSVESYHAAEKSATAKPRVVVLGSGWAAASFMKALPSDVK